MGVVPLLSVLGSLYVVWSCVVFGGLALAWASVRDDRRQALADQEIWGDV